MYIILIFKLMWYAVRPDLINWDKERGDLTFQSTPALLGIWSNFIFLWVKMDGDPSTIADFEIVLGSVFFFRLRPHQLSVILI